MMSILGRGLQVKKTEAALEQVTREKQELSQALASEKRRALGKGGQARLGNLALRVQILVSTVHLLGNRPHIIITEISGYPAQICRRFCLLGN